MNPAIAKLKSPGKTEEVVHKPCGYDGFTDQGIKQQKMRAFQYREPKHLELIILSSGKRYS